MNTLQKLIKKMGNGILAVVMLSLFGACNNIDKAKYKKGDIVYLKPDCREGVIWDVNRIGYMYSISLDPDDWTCIKVDEEQIFGTDCPK